MKSITKQLLCTLLTASVCLASAAAFADGYYDATAEVNQIRSFMNDGMYLEVIRDCNNTMAWHNLSPDDISLLRGYAADAEKRYDDFINGTAGYYDASAEMRQIRSFINDGMYIEAMQCIEQTYDWHNLSPDDITTLVELYSTAETKYQGYLESSALKKYLGIWHSDDGAYDLNVTEINGSYAVCKIEKLRGKEARYSLGKAYFTYSDFAETDGTISYPAYGTSITSHFGFEFQNNVVRMYIDGEITMFYR